MRDVVYIDGSKETPSVIFDKVNNKFEIKGKSLPEDVNEFYQGVIQWLRDYAKEPNPETLFTINLEYYNSASVRKIVDILVVLENIYRAGNKVLIRWMFDESDEMMGENGEDFKATVDVPFEIVPYKPIKQGK